MMCLCVVCFMFLVLGIHWASWIHKFTVCVKFWKLLDIIISNTFSDHPSSCPVEVPSHIPWGSWAWLVETDAIPSSQALALQSFRVIFHLASGSFLTCVYWYLHYEPFPAYPFGYWIHTLPRHVFPFMLYNFPLYLLPSGIVSSIIVGFWIHFVYCCISSIQDSATLTQ